MRRNRNSHASRHISATGCTTVLSGRLTDNNSVDPLVVPIYFGNMFWKVEVGAGAVLRGMNPPRLMDEGWEAHKEGDLIRIVGRLAPGNVVLDAAPEIEVVLDPSRGYAPVRMIARATSFREEIVVQEWKSISDPALPRWMRESTIWLPARIDSTIRLDLPQKRVVQRHRQHRLMEVRSASGTAPQWLKRDIVVSDYRSCWWSSALSGYWRRCCSRCFRPHGSVRARASVPVICDR